MSLVPDKLLNKVGQILPEVWHFAIFIIVIVVPYIAFECWSREILSMDSLSEKS